MPKILFFNSLFYPDSYGGAEKTMKIIVDGLQQRGYDVVVAALRPHLDKLEQDDDGPYRVYRVPILNVDHELFTEKLVRIKRIVWKLIDVYNYRQAKLAKKIIQIEKPDIVFCHNIAGWSSSLWMELSNYNIPIVQVVHDLYTLCPRCMFKNGHSCIKRCAICNLLRLPYQIASKHVDAVISISNYIQDTITKYSFFPHVKKRVIYNTRIIQEPARRSTEFKSFGFIGNVQPHKGIELLLEAFHKTSIPSKLIVAGNCEVEYRNHLNNIIENDERIEFIGYVNPAEFYKKINVLVVPSLWEEPLGMVAVEALANNIPVITTGAGGLSEIVKDDLNGVIFKPYESSALKEVLEKIFYDVDYYKMLQSNSRRSISTFINMNRQIDEFEEVIKQIISIAI